MSKLSKLNKMSDKIKNMVKDNTKKMKNNIKKIKNKMKKMKNKVKKINGKLDENKLSESNLNESKLSGSKLSENKLNGSKLDEKQDMSSDVKIERFVYCYTETMTFVGSNYTFILPICLILHIDYWWKFKSFNYNNLVYKTSLSKKLLSCYLNITLTITINCNCLEYCKNKKYSNENNPCQRQQIYKNSIIENLTFLEVLDIFKFAHETQTEKCIKKCLSYFDFDIAVVIPKSIFVMNNNGHMKSYRNPITYYKYDSIEKKQIQTTLDEIRTEIMDIENTNINMDTINMLIEFSKLYSIEHISVLQTIGFYLDLYDKVSFESKCLVAYSKI